MKKSVYKTQTHVCIINIKSVHKKERNIILFFYTNIEKIMQDQFCLPFGL